MYQFFTTQLLAASRSTFVLLYANKILLCQQTLVVRNPEDLNACVGKSPFFLVCT
jgi:hypothetical protein